MREQKIIRAIIIKPEQRSITEEMIEPSLENLYKIIGCDTITIAYLANGDLAVVDDNGLLKQNLVSEIYGYHLAGIIVILGDKDGEFADAISDIESLECNSRLAFTTVR